MSTTETTPVDSRPLRKRVAWVLLVLGLLAALGR